MTPNEFQERLLARAKRADIPLATSAQLQLETYFRLLVKWNAKINLTALPLCPPTDHTFDRLLIEPIVAARYVPDTVRSWIDVGSGGGSPAIPLKIVQPGAKLTMVESRTRKAAFLRDVVRILGLADATVENRRFEELALNVEAETIDLVTVRAVKSSLPLLAGIRRVLSPAGRLFLFHGSTAELDAPGFAIFETVRLGTGDDAQLIILKRMFHVEQNR